MVPSRSAAPQRPFTGQASRELWHCQREDSSVGGDDNRRFAPLGGFDGHGLRDWENFLLGEDFYRLRFWRRGRGTGSNPLSARRWNTVGCPDDVRCCLEERTKDSRLRRRMRRRFEHMLDLNRRKATAACPTSLGIPENHVS
jgi:hypothetical protein